MKENISITGLWLRRIGDHAVVEIEVNGKWIEVVRERVEGPFSHIVEGAGIKSLLAGLS